MSNWRSENDQSWRTETPYHGRPYNWPTPVYWTPPKRPAAQPSIANMLSLARRLEKEGDTNNALEIRKLAQQRKFRLNAKWHRRMYPR